MNIPKANRPKWATHFMYQFGQRGCNGFWVGEKVLQIQRVDADGSVDGDLEAVPRVRMLEYLKGDYSLTVQRLSPIVLENK